MTLMSRNALLNLIPNVRWVPHDIPNGEGSEKAHRSLFSRHLSGKGKSHGAKGLPVQSPSSFPGSSSSSRVDPIGFQMGRPRKYALTLTGTHDPALDLRTKNQMQSTFFGKLPYEIRIMIYEYLGGEGETIHLIIGYKPRSYHHFVCDEDHAVLEDRSQHLCRCKVIVGGTAKRRLNTGLLSFMRACRRTYSESIHYLYNPHTFSLLHAAHLIFLPEHLPLPRLNMIRKLRVRWTIRALPFLRRPNSPKSYAYKEETANWIKAWNILAHMEGLEDLYVVLGEMRPQVTIWERGWLELEDTLLEPVKMVVRPSSFVLVLPYGSCQLDRDFGESKVVLRKPGVGLLTEQ